MKCLFELLGIFSFITSVLGIETRILNVCPNECSSLKTCIDAEYTNQTEFILYPPYNDEFGKCNCQDEVEYLKCINCYHSNIYRTIIQDTKLKERCANRMLPPDTTVTYIYISSNINSQQPIPSPINYETVISDIVYDDDDIDDQNEDDENEEEENNEGIF